MTCPIIRRRNGRMALGVVVLASLIYRPPQSAMEVALYGAGTYGGLLLVDSMSASPDWSFMIRAEGNCGCSKSRTNA
jgi:hypothetical protein